MNLNIVKQISNSSKLSYTEFSEIIENLSLVNVKFFTSFNKNRFIEFINNIK